MEGGQERCLFSRVDHIKRSKIEWIPDKGECLIGPTGSTSGEGSKARFVVP